MDGSKGRRVLDPCHHTAGVRFRGRRVRRGGGGEKWLAKRIPAVAKAVGGDRSGGCKSGWGVTGLAVAKAVGGDQPVVGHWERTQTVGAQQRITRRPPPLGHPAYAQPLSP